MLFLEKEKLKHYIKAQVPIEWKQRDFVADVKEYINSPIHQVYLVSGLRGVGKTTGILQAIKDEDAVYIMVQLDEAETAQDYRTKLKACEAKVIVIDEYSWIQDRELLDGLLYTLVQNGKRVIITGNESVTLNYLKYGNLIHRVIIQQVTYFSYQEYCRLNEKKLNVRSCEEYLEKGGLFTRDMLDSYSAVSDYIKTAIIDNLVSYCKGGFCAENITAIVYTILYKAICDSVPKTFPIYKGDYLSLVDFLELFHVSTSYCVEASDFDEIVTILENIGVIVKVQNYRIKKECRTYIANPSMIYQLIKCIYKLDSLDKGLLGYIFESSCVCDLNLKKTMEQKIYYIEGRKGENGLEINFMLIDRSYSHNQSTWLFQCDFSENTVLHKTASLVSDTLENLIPDNEIWGRYVWYIGENKWEKVNGREVMYVRGCRECDYADF